MMIEVHIPLVKWVNAIHENFYIDYLAFAEDYGFEVYSRPIHRFLDGIDYVKLNFKDEDKAMWFKLKYL